MIATEFIATYGPMVLGVIIAIIVCIGFALKGYDGY